MSKNTESNDQGAETKPAPTGNPVTRDGNGGEQTKPVPTGNRGTFSEDPPIRKK